MSLDQTYYTAVCALKDSADIDAVDEVAKQVRQLYKLTPHVKFEALQYRLLSDISINTLSNSCCCLFQQVSQGRYGTVADLFKALIDAPGYNLDLQKAR